MCSDRRGKLPTGASGLMPPLGFLIDAQGPIKKRSPGFSPQLLLLAWLRDQDSNLD